MPYLYGGLTLFYAANEKNNTKAANLSHALAYTKQAASDIYNTQVPKSVSQNTPSSENSQKNLIFDGFIEPIGDYFEDLWDDYRTKHFEERIKLNGIPPTHDEVAEDYSEWLLCDDEESIFHDNGKGEKEKKYVHPDGREAVFDGDTLKNVTDPKYMATYNYGKYLPEDSYEKTVPGYINYAVDGIPHVVHDVLPYLIFLQSNTREDYESKKNYLDQSENVLERLKRFYEIHSGTYDAK